MAELSDEDKFKQMLEVDKKTYEMLASMRIFLEDPKSRSHQNYSAIEQSYNELFERYNERQDDYRNNPVYKLGNTISEYADKTIEWFKDAWNSLFGLGAAPLVVPVAIAAGAVLSIAAVSYFVYRYYSETSTDYNEALSTLELLARHNPALAEKMADQLTYIKKQEQSGGFFSQIGSGVKVALITVGVVAGVGGLFALNNKYQWVKF